MRFLNAHYALLNAHKPKRIFPHEKNAWPTLIQTLPLEEYEDRSSFCPIPGWFSISFLGSTALFLCPLSLCPTSEFPSTPTPAYYDSLTLTLEFSPHPLVHTQTLLHTCPLISAQGRRHMLTCQLSQIQTLWWYYGGRLYCAYMYIFMHVMNSRKQIIPC